MQDTGMRTVATMRCALTARETDQTSAMLGGRRKGLYNTTLDGALLKA